ncbi:unnamed protein product [Zymoseptoria tritici ST99CH_1A5]|uniref:alpha-galactosidase n=1 Tax=Zymoseptoria tritici ST99CH_1A5 TaxID=1276529 RepID=A0A1Y6LNN2_ZYMTR|nr:unnamed protein product [Zymoseptoria tritici ST99CH_1A5]
MKFTTLVLTAASLLTSSFTSAGATVPSFRLKPTPNTSWNIQLSSVPTLSSATTSPKPAIYDVDLIDTPASLISSLHAANISVICYFSAGSYENWRSDASSWPKAALGKDMDGWEGEKWVDVRSSGVRDVMKKRIALAKSKGCDGVDPDNIDGYNNDSGFPLTQSDAISFVTFLSTTAHAAGLSYGLKNGGDIVPQVVNLAEWVINEECTFYNECELYKPFIDAGKAVLHIEYPDTKKKLSEKQFIEFACKGKNQSGFSTLVKKRNLDDWTRRC